MLSAQALQETDVAKHVAREPKHGSLLLAAFIGVEKGLREHSEREAALQKSVLSDQVVRISDPAAKEMRSSDYGPLARGQRNLQARLSTLH